MNGGSRTATRYESILRAREAYQAGLNVASFLREEAGLHENDQRVVEIAYDLQAGSYTAIAIANPEQTAEYGQELAQILRHVLQADDVLLDAGTGECTALTAMLNSLPTEHGTLAFDISWSRLLAGREYARSHLSTEKRRPELFVADIEHMPLHDDAVDVALTVHALEPNGGNEIPLLRSLLRVARRYLVLFEPSYENAPDGAKERMRKHRYVRGLPEAIAAVGGILEEVVPLPHPANPLNPTYAFIVRTPRATARPATTEGVWRCPVTARPLAAVPEGLWSSDAGLLYPAIQGIPMLRPEHALLVSAYSPRG